MSRSRTHVQVRLPVELILRLKELINAEAVISAQGERAYHYDNPILKEDEAYTTILKVFLLASIDRYVTDKQAMKQLIRRTGGVSEIDVDRASKRLNPEAQVLVPGGLLKAVYEQQTEYLQQVREDIKRQTDVYLNQQMKEEAQRALIYQGVLGSLVNYPLSGLEEAYGVSGEQVDALVRRQLQQLGLDDEVDFISEFRRQAVASVQEVETPVEEVVSEPAESAPEPVSSEIPIEGSQDDDEDDASDTPESLLDDIFG